MSVGEAATAARTGRTFGYSRASTDKQAASPDAQREAIAAAARSAGLVVDAWFQDAPIVHPDGWIDDSASGKVFISRRRAGGELMARLKRGDRVIVATLDRPFRSLADCATCLDRWKRLGANLLVADMMGLIDLSSPCGKTMVQMLVVFAELERKMLSQRTKEGLATRKRKGQATGRYAGYGHRFERRWDREQGKFVKMKVVDHDERAVMREIVKWRLDGHTWDTIRQHLVYTLKFLTKEGRPWSESRIIRAFHAELKLQQQENRG